MSGNKARQLIFNTHLTLRAFDIHTLLYEYLLLVIGKSVTTFIINVFEISKCEVTLVLCEMLT